MNKDNLTVAVFVICLILSAAWGVIVLGVGVGLLRWLLG